MMEEARQIERNLSREYKMKIKLVETEMHEKMVKTAVRFACEGVEQKKAPHDIAETIVKAFTKAMGHSHWHCIVGKRYGSNVSHEPSYYLYFYVEQWAIMLFRTRERCEREMDEKLERERDRAYDYDDDASEYY